MSDSGFVDEAPTGRGVPTSGARCGAHSQESDGAPARRASVFVVLVVALLAFGSWAWSSRVHADDVAAYESLAREVEELDRSMVPLGHSELPPCRESIDGRSPAPTRPRRGPRRRARRLPRAEGLDAGAAVPPVVAPPDPAENGHVLTVDVAAGALTARRVADGQQPRSSLGCLGR